MRPAAAAALVLAGLVACAPGYTNGTFHPGDAGGPSIGGGASDGGDAGADAGDAGPDAGSDAGCVPLTLKGVYALDNCLGGAPTTATGTVNIGNCTIDIALSTSTGPCRGTVSHGTSNAFSGTCESGFYVCISPSLPGTLTCAHGTTTCTIKICDAGTSCP